MQVEDYKINLNPTPKTEVDKWILTSLQKLIKDVSRDIENYQYSNA